MILNLIKKRILENQQSKTRIFTDENNVKTVCMKTTDKITIKAWLVLPKVPKKDIKFLVCLHGNRINREMFYNKFNIDDIVNKYNVVILIPDYRDFGDSEGFFEKDRVNKDISACLQFMTSFFDLDTVDIMGHSLGGGIALNYLAYIHDCTNKPATSTKSSCTHTNIPPAVHNKKFCCGNDTENCEGGAYNNRSLLPEVHSIECCCGDAIQDYESGAYNHRSLPPEVHSIECCCGNSVQDYESGVYNHNTNVNAKDIEGKLELRISKISKLLTQKKDIYFEAFDENKNIVNKTIIVSTFTSVFDMLETSATWKIIKYTNPFGVYRINALYNYNNITNIQKLNKDMIKVFHGECDELIPIKHGKKLAQCINADLCIIKNCDHNNILTNKYFWETAMKFLEQ